MTGRPGKRLMIWLVAYAALICLAIGLAASLSLSALRETREAPYVAAFSQDNLFFAQTEPPINTPLPSPELSVIAETPEEPEITGFEVEVIGREQEQKRVLIYHTHTYEAFEQEGGDRYQETEKWRTADSRYNVVRLGGELSALLTAQGVSVTHDSTAFEMPSLATSYERSLSMLEDRIAAGEEYDLYIDLHRDAYSESVPGGNCVTVGDMRLARIMLLIGKGEGQTTEGFETSTEWEKNLAIANAITEDLNAQHEGLCRNVRVKSGRFNQHIAPRCVLIEVGNNKNTLSEALSSMPCLADAIVAYLSQ